MSAVVAPFHPRINPDEIRAQGYAEGYRDGERAYREYANEQFFTGILLGLLIAVIFVAGVLGYVNQ